MQDENAIQFLNYLRTEINSQWPITESTRIQTTAKGKEQKTTK
jgi:hypothetical protein